jgi:hypothetical protein
MQDREALTTTVVFLFDQLRARTEALEYAAGLAGRMGFRLVLLVLLRLEETRSDAANDTDCPEDTVTMAVEPHLRTAQSVGVPVESVLRVGDPSSELMKYLAETRTIHTIVWGGDQATLHQRTQRDGPHWLVKIRDRVHVPVVVPVLKSRPQ